MLDFGVALTKLKDRANRPDQLPAILYYCTEFLKTREEGARTHGLFRVSGEKTELLRVKQMFNTCMQLTPPPPLPPRYSITNPLMMMMLLLLLMML
jgi:hypothetical protein